MRTAVDLGFQALAYASVLYLISVGLSVTLGLMRFVNLAHGIFAMAGGYLAATAIDRWGWSWYLTLLVVPLLVAVMGAVLERGLYARLYGRPELDQVLFCIGLILIASATARWLFGPLLKPLAVPAKLLHVWHIGGVGFLVHKVTVIVIGLLTAAGVLFGLEGTPYGARVRAAVENRGMAEAVGIRTGMIYTLTFALGGALAALGGILGAEVFGINPTYPLDVLVYAQLVVAVTGLGTARGAFVGAFVLSLIQTVTAYFVPQLGTMPLFMAVFLFILWRPEGLYGQRELLT